MVPKDTVSRGLAQTLISVLALGVVGCGASPTGPLTTQPQSLTVGVTSGLRQVGIGKTTQLTVSALYRSGSATIVTTGVTWRSSNTTRATVSDAGVLTAVALGDVTITAEFAGRSGTLGLSVVSEIEISACGAYLGPGPFVLTSDLPASPSLCLTFQRVSDASLDCRGFEAGSIGVSDVDGMLIRDCRLHGPREIGAGGVNGDYNLGVQNSTSVTIERAHIIGQVFFAGCQSCTMRESTVGVRPDGYCGTGSSAVRLINGNHNQVLNTTIGGGWDGQYTDGLEPPGCDDGIVFVNDVNDTFEGNTISNVWDGAIEPAGDQVVTVTIRSNVMTNSRVGGIVSFHTPGWRDSVISNNVVSRAHTLLYLVSPSSASSGFPRMIFTDNQITNNTFLDPLPAFPGDDGDTTMVIDFIHDSTSYVVGGNLIQGNHLGTARGAPVLVPPAGFIDGGGNICTAGSVLACGGWLPR